MRKLTLVDTGATGTIKALVPFHDRKAGWVVKERPVAVHGSEDEARAFAASILASWQAHHDAWVAREAPAARKGCATACPTCGRMGFRKGGTGLAWHVERCAA